MPLLKKSKINSESFTAVNHESQDATKLNQQNYRKLISGQSSGPVAAVLRLLLMAAAQVYLVVIVLRNFLYSRGWLKTYRANATVISVGNITAGGTGKTPLVIWLCKLLQQKEIPCAVLTRGYKTRTRKRAARTDEPAIIAENCPNTKVIINQNRAAAAAEAVEKFGAKVLIMDDGFQHRRLNRDLDIVTIDSAVPFGYDRVLPAGLLREPLTGLKRADVVVVTRCGQTDEVELARLEEKLQSINPDMIIAKSTHEPVCAKSQDGRLISTEELKNKKIFAFCGIGNPDSFLNTIRKLGAELLGCKVYNDHYHYKYSDITDICRQARRLNADLILTTEKDWANTDQPAPVQKDIPLGYLAIELKLISGKDTITQLIDRSLTGKISEN